MKSFWTLVKVKRDEDGEVESVIPCGNGYYSSCCLAEDAGIINAATDNCEIVAMKSFSICKYKFENILE